MGLRVSLLKPQTGGALGLEMITLTEPLGLECVAAALEACRHTCQIIDCRLDGTLDGLAKVRSFGPEVIGLQCNFTTERFRTQSLARELKLEYPDVPVIIGGHDASRAPEWFRDWSIDAVVIGDGEATMTALVDALSAGKDIQTVPGLMVNTPLDPVYTQAAPLCKNLDDFPPPARHLIKDYEEHYYNGFSRPLALVETSRGCPFRCNFCSVWKFHQGTVREKSVERVVQELEQVKAPHVFIADDIFWMNARRSVEMADTLKGAGISKHFFMQTRTDIIVKQPELIAKWRDCGKLSIFLGLEKVDDEGLSSVNKKNSAAVNDRAIDILKDMDVGYTPNFIVDPAWEREDFDKLHRWIDRTGSYNSSFSVLTPLPGTDLWADFENKVTTKDWELYDLEHTVLPTRMSIEDFYLEYSKLWKHVLDLRYKARGRTRMHLQLLAGLATRRTTVSALRKGLMIAKILSKPSTFLQAHKA